MPQGNIKTKKQLKKYIMNELIKCVEEKLPEWELAYWNQLVSEAPTIPMEDAFPKGLLGELREQACREAEKEWRAGNDKPKIRPNIR